VRWERGMSQNPPMRIFKKLCIYSCNFVQKERPLLFSIVCTYALNDLALINKTSLDNKIQLFIQFYDDIILKLLKNFDFKTGMEGGQFCREQGNHEDSEKRKRNLQFLFDQKRRLL